MAQALSTPTTATTGRNDTRETAQATTAADRRIYNPAQKDAVIFLETAEETNGAYSLLQMEVAPGGGNVLHYHKAFAEHFTVISGEFGVQVGKDVRVLRPGQSAVAPAGSRHRWYNTSQQTATVRVELRPASPGFERMLRITYGLARDGQVNQQGLPTNIWHMALLVEMSDTSPTGLFSAVAPLLRALAKLARRRGIERELVERYCR
jgi:quercetin dioxygenase-like cupin family protein